VSPKLEELLLRWEDGRQNGHPVSVDTLCSDCPDLRKDLLAQIAALEKMDQVLDLADGGKPIVMNERRPTRFDNLRSGWEPINGYRLEKRLGKGGFGEVWKANRPGKSPVALKFVSLIGQLGASERRSVDLIRTLRHPNVLTVFGAWQVHGFLVIAMEMANRTLLDRLNEAIEKGETGIPHDELIKYIEEAAKGIDYLNLPDADSSDSAKEAIQHRDIKPQNIFLVGDSLKIGDFGLLRILKKTVTEHTGSLTVSYAAPEFFMGHTSRSSDQYSLAVTYCHLLGGRLPFVGQPGQIMQGHLQGTPDLTMLPEAERAILLRALAKNPEKRWPTCTAFVQALRQSTTKAIDQPKTWRFRKTGALILGAAALVISCVMVLVSYSWLGHDQAKDSITQSPASGDSGGGNPGVPKSQPEKDKSDGLSKKESVTPDPFSHLVLNNATRMDGFVRLGLDSWISTKENYSGPIEITAVARTEHNNIRVHAFNGACVIFNWEVNRGQLRVHRPDGNEHRNSGSLATAKVQPLDPNKWHTLRCRITGQGMRVQVDGKSVFSENKKNNLSANRPIVITSHDSRIDVKSLVVIRLGPKEKP
jgi:serine/threonine protein kinase